MLKLTVAVPSTLRPLKVGRGSTNLGMVVPSSGVCATTVCAAAVCAAAVGATLVTAPILVDVATGSLPASHPSVRSTRPATDAPKRNCAWLIVALHQFELLLRARS
jgi:hypothetical protein